MDVYFSTSTKDYKAISETIKGLKTLKQKLQYYNDNYIGLVNYNVRNCVEIKVKDLENLENNYTLFCTCVDCKDKFTVNDFEIYRDFVNNLIDKKIEFFKATTSYKDKLEQFYKLNSNYPTNTISILKYVPHTIDEVKDYYNLKEVSIDVTPQNKIEFDILLEFIKTKIICSDNYNATMPKRTLLKMDSEMYNPKSFVFENRVTEITNYLEYENDENDRKDLIKKYLDNINLNKIDIEKATKNPNTSASKNIEILKIVDKIIQNEPFESVIHKTKFREIEYYLLALETIKFKRFLNSLNVSISEQNKIIFDNLPVNQRIEIRTIENELKNNQILNEYYNNIKHINHFENAILNKESEFYFVKAINEFTEYSNTLLNKIELLNENLEILKPFNYQINEILKQVLYCYKSVVEWKNTNNGLHENNLEVRFSCKLSYLKNDFITTILYNYDVNPLLAFRLNEYCLNGFDIMISFIESQLNINIKESPLFVELNELVNKFNEVKVKIEPLARLTPGFLSTQKLQQPRLNTDVQVLETKKELYNNIFVDNAFELFEKYHKTKQLFENCKNDLNLLFQLFTNDNLFLDTIELKHYIKWLNNTYSYSIVTLKKVNKNSKNNIQKTNDYKEYKKTTLK